MRISVTFDVRLTTMGRQPDDLDLCDDEEEFDSPATIQALAEVLEGLGHEVDLLGDGEPMLRRLLHGPRPDLVLNIAEGCGHLRSREARVPAVLEMLGIPHTGSDPLTLAATLDKDCAKRLVVVRRRGDSPLGVVQRRPGSRRKSTCRPPLPRVRQAGLRRVEQGNPGFQLD